VLRTRRSAIVLCVAIVLCIALVPAPYVSGCAILVPVWSLFAFVPETIVAGVDDETPSHPDPSRSLLSPRAPPA
jgi:hypothetical protein